MAVRPKVRRAFYEATYGKGAANVTHSTAAFGDATFDEYLALMRVLYPQTTARIVASQAFFSPAFRALAATLPREESEEEEDFVWWVPPKPRPKKANAIALVSAQGADLAALGRVTPLRTLTAARCKGEVVPSASPLDVAALEVSDCAPAFVKGLLASTSARELTWIESRKAAIDLAWLARQRRLRALVARGPAVLHVASLARVRSLESIELSRVRADATLTTVLAALSSLTELSLVTSDPITPDALPVKSLPKLRRVVVSAHPPAREAWLRFATSRPDIGFVFDAPPAKASTSLPEIDVVETWRDVELLSIVVKKAKRFRIESDVAEAIGYADSNGDLEDELAAIAVRAKKKVSWGSEADTLVATCDDLATCRWVVDQAHALVAPPRGASPRARGPR
jgi:hypothetical protein